MRKPYYEVYQGTDGYWRWRQVAANGRKTAASGESFVSRRNAVKAVVVSARMAYELVDGITYTNFGIERRLEDSGSIRICPQHTSEPKTCHGYIGPLGEYNE